MMIIKAIATLFFMLYAPYFTLGAVLWYYDHGIIAFISWIFSFFDWYENKDPNKKYFIDWWL